MSTWEDKRLATGRQPTTKDVREGEIYGDERHSHSGEDSERLYPVRYEVVYADENRVLLRDADGTDDYRHERIPEFLEGLGTRWTRLESGSGSTELTSVPDFDAALRVLKYKQARFTQRDSRKGDHMAEGIDEAISVLRDFEPQPIEWTSIPGIGPQTAEKIEDRGITTIESE